MKKSKEYMKIHNAKPEVKARKKLHNDNPEVIARRKLYEKSPEVKARRRLYWDTPEVKARRIAYTKSSAVVAKAIKKLYNLAIEEYQEMFIKQNGCCAICGKHQSEFKKRLAVDHNHETNEFRGLLCIKCNNGIGCFDDDIELLSNAINYLNKPLEVPKI
jgi:hypothetical protein